MYQLIYSSSAEADLIEIFENIREVSEYNAVRYMAKLEKHILKLKAMPTIGVNPKYPELIALNIKMLIFEKYLIFFRISEQKNQVEIVRVLASKRNYARLFD
ncbi:MAG: type II toxin-antitoxin system RelE/ParE family toxin [Bacillota bacterium]